MARKVSYDQDKVKELRMKVIEDSLHVFAGKSTSSWSQYRRDLLMKYAPRVLPVLNAGKDDDHDLFPSTAEKEKANEALEKFLDK